MNSQLEKSEYEKILSFINQISPTYENLREQIQVALDHVWGYNNTIFWLASDDGSVFNPELYGIENHTMYEYKEHFEDLDLLHPKQHLNTLHQQKIFNFTNTFSHHDFYNSDFFNEFLCKYEFADEMAVNFVYDNKL